MSKVRISVSLFNCTVWLVRCVRVWVSDRAWDRLGHNDTLQQVTCCRKEKKQKTKKKSRHDENAHVGLIHLTSPSASCLAADPSQFVFRKAQKEVPARSFWKSTRPLLCLPAARTASSWIINFCGQGRAKVRPGQPWINDISGWLREALPSQRNQSPLPRQRHINLSGKSFAFPSYPLSILPLSLSACLRLTSRLLSWKCSVIN